MMVDSETELINVLGVADTIMYNYRIVNLDASTVDRAALERAIYSIRPDSVRQACSTPETRQGLLDRGIKMQFRYHDQHREYITYFTISRSDCP